MVSGDLDARGRSLAHRARSAVIIVDGSNRLLTHGAVDGQVGRVFTAAILTRQLPVELRRALRLTSLRRVESPVEVETGATDSLPVTVCPVRYQDAWLGYVLIEGTDKVRFRKDIEEIANAAAVALRRRTLFDRVHAETETELVGQLLDEHPSVRETAARRLLERKSFPARSVVALTIVPDGKTDVSRQEAEALLRHLVAIDEPELQGHLTADCTEHLVVLLPASQSDRKQREVSRLAALIRTRLLSRISAPDGLVIGYGSTQVRLEEAHVSVRQALTAARIALAVPSLGSTIGWTRLGMFSVVAAIPSVLARTEIIPAEITEFLGMPENAELAETLEWYLDLGSDVKATAATMSLHPATIRYRLAKIERTLALNLKDGQERFLLHFAVKLQQLQHILT